ncbi:pilus assembly protein TadG-related protein [Sinomonas susongensis]|uniref:pilus assembly protein TadG-related protein n=1 Tax=Sinomonas susongensis TaxID=1324851 RepID=UPI001486F99C|nr:pilus assembly protein TadG-related protein [Sinomonas susongensis]
MMVAILALVLIGVGAIAVDVGRIYSKRGELQNGADAAALAVADNCARYASSTGCSTGVSTTSLALQYAKDNSLTSTANVSDPIIDTVAGTVTVTATVKEPSGSNSLSLTLANALGFSSAQVGATATASWGYPTKGQSILPLAMEACELNVNSSSATPIPQKVITQGGGGADCNGTNPSNQNFPGGFAWLSPTGPGPCQVTATAGPESVLSTWIQTSNGASLPNGCGSLFTAGDPNYVLGQTVAVPVYDDLSSSPPVSNPNANGNNTWYHIAKWAGFHVLGWNFPGSTAGPAVWNKSEKGIYGYFVGFSADPSLFSNFTTDPNGKGDLYVVKLLK